ncbi:hypothetical protein LMG28688_06955 [Paraburkholderia caffeinitolerans]|uniref:Uncharacterized protein n=1 Tax=Paraburkholderia caffeinitolerans TaxID=1723730 RepID=A0A6J5H5H1_9BURK|nr:hypothetical protein LMG28688_06955 [Paraburkholderia caffeinitolerans]
MTQRFAHTISKIDHATPASDLRNSPDKLAKLSSSG